MRDDSDRSSKTNFPSLAWDLIHRVPEQATLGGIFFLMIFVFAFLVPRFFTASNMLSVLRQSSTLFMLACGQTLVILVKGIDLSQGAVIGMVSITTAHVIVTYGPLPGVLAGILVGGLFGVISGLVVSRLRVPDFVATLGMLFIVEGITLMITEGQPIFGLPESPGFLYLGQGFIGAIPFPAVLFVLVGICFYIVLKFTRFGRFLYAIGGNEEAARLSGIQVKNWRTAAYTVNGLLVGLGAVILTSRVNSGQPFLGGGYMMESLGAVVIGGTSLFGGRGGILQTVTGVCFLAFMANGLTIMGMSTFVRQALVGILIIASVYLSVMRTK